MNQAATNDVLISKRNSLIIRGGAILLMLIHHLFYSPASRELYDDVIVSGIGLVNQLGIFSKVCVAIFVFLSGYGLVVSTPKDVSLKDFYLHRFKKLYLNYWYIWLLFVPVSVFVFGRTFADAYGDHIAVKSVLDFFGLLKMFGVNGYNPTWWFYSCIIVLYLLFPLLNKWLWRVPFFVICVSLTCGLLSRIPGINVIAGYLIVFVTGMLMARMPLSWLKETKIWQLLLVLVLLSAWRFAKSTFVPVADTFICAGIAILVYKLPLWHWLSRIFEELGKHSMNMFLTHTFIYYYWFKDYIYITRNPILIFLSLTISCYSLSVLIEWTKQKVGFYKLLRS